MPVFTKILLKTKISGTVQPEEVDRREIVFGDDERSFFIKTYRTGLLSKFARLDDNIVTDENTWSAEKILSAISEYGASPATVSDRVIGEVPSGTIDGVNVRFETSRRFKAFTLEVFYNGLRLKRNSDFILDTETHKHFELTFAPEPGEDTDTHDTIIVNYYVYDSVANPEPVVGEVPTGLIDGVNSVYETDEPFIQYTLSVFMNGLRLKSGLDYTVDSFQQFTMIYPPEEEDSLIVDYFKLNAGGTGGFTDGTVDPIGGSTGTNQVIYVVPTTIDGGILGDPQTIGIDPTLIGEEEEYTKIVCSKVCNVADGGILGDPTDNPCEVVQCLVGEEI